MSGTEGVVRVPPGGTCCALLGAWGRAENAWPTWFSVTAKSPAECVFWDEACDCSEPQSLIRHLGDTVVVVVQPLGHIQLLATPWTTARQASLSSTISRSLFKFTSVELVMPSNHLTLCRRLLLLSSIFLSIRVFSSESALHIRWPKYWSFSFLISPFNEFSGLICFKIDWFNLFAVETVAMLF